MPTVMAPRITAIRMARSETADPAALLKLMTFVSPAFPIGAFAYSHGVEWLIDSGAASNAADLEMWLTDLLEVGTGWNDSVLFVEAFRAAEDADPQRLMDVAELAEALAPSSERWIETMQQGGAFLRAILSAWPCQLCAELQQAGGAALPVSVAAAAAGHGIALQDALLAYLNAFCANLVSVAVRLVPLGQTAGLQVLATMHGRIVDITERAVSSSLDDLGSAAVLSDVASMRHEEQYSRVFRT